MNGDIHPEHGLMDAENHHENYMMNGENPTLKLVWWTHKAIMKIRGKWNIYSN